MKKQKASCCTKIQLNFKRMIVLLKRIRDKLKKICDL